jgi:hypothetical protein
VTVVVDVVDHQFAGRDLTGTAVVDVAAGLSARTLAGQRDSRASKDDLVVHLASWLADRRPTVSAWVPVVEPAKPAGP